MSRMATLSALGLYNWDNTLFDLMYIPEGLDKEVLITTILTETAELEIIYPNHAILKSLIGVWSHKEKPVWDKLYKTTQFDYNPIENYNRYEEGTEESTGNTAHSGTDTTTGTSTTGGTDTVTMTRASGGEDTTTGADTKGHWVAGFDAGTATETDDGLFKQTRDQDDAETTTEYGKTENGTDKTAYGKTERETGSKTFGEKIAEDKSGSHTLHMHGNIGVMSTQDMITQEREVDLFNLYDIIVDGFKAKFCITVY